MKKKSEFYTLKGYRLKNNTQLTEAMEDYLEMIYRKTHTKEEVSLKELANELNVLSSSASKMIKRLKEKKLVTGGKYDLISLTQKGKEIGAYLLWRHNILTAFFQKLNQENFSLEQVEKIEHFIDDVTLENMLNNLEK